MIDRLKRFLADASGATAIEYAMIAAMIALTIVVSLTAVTGGIKNVFNEVSGNLG
ncbi:Flp family type IVb pilin [Methylocapsa sp. S129]|uniref:Flp family type IVb pilin n=1 Tax=Methylocapsa sp. S129 TaxID=1641869 RepID=UPI001FEEA21F|nr:Flp family type IVb pilin [Methylocapsa sp. S129]